LITKISGKCQYKGCNKKATDIACGRTPLGTESVGFHPTPGCYCKEHAYKVQGEDSPEYGAICPNCDCLFGVN